MVFALLRQAGTKMPRGSWTSFVTHCEPVLVRHLLPITRTGQSGGLNKSSVLTRNSSAILCVQIWTTRQSRPVEPAGGLYVY